MLKLLLMNRSNIAFNSHWEVHIVCSQVFPGVLPKSSEKCPTLLEGHKLERDCYGNGVKLKLCVKTTFLSKFNLLFFSLDQYWVSLLLKNIRSFSCIQDIDMPHLKDGKRTEPLWKEWDQKAQKKGIRNTVYSVNRDEYTGEWLENRRHGTNIFDISLIYANF